MKWILNLETGHPLTGEWRDMDGITKNDVIGLAKELDVKFIRLQFTDIFGTLKNVAITVDRLPEALDGQITFDGSSIEGLVRVEESDMFLRPDPSTFTIFPWRPRHGAVARLICDVYTPDGKPFAGCPRTALKRVLAETEALGYETRIGIETEFFLFQTDEAGRPTATTHDEGGYFDLSPIDRGEDARRDIVLTLEEMGLQIDASHHEGAPGQHEIALRHGEALRAADNVVTLKHVIRTAAQRHGLYASFMPKPNPRMNGSGMHISQSLFDKEGRNLFFDPAKPHGLSDVALHYIAGLLEHSRGFCAITNPIVNSYKRLVPGFEAPISACWSFQNRSPLVRIPVHRGKATRIELRNPDPSCNPYLAIACAIRSGIAGIEGKLTPPEPVTGNVFDMSDERSRKLGIRRLPRSLAEALDELERDELIKGTLGEYIFQKFMESKRDEWERYARAVHEWEFTEYLSKI